MEIKKTEKANLENKKLLFLEIGLIVALVAVFVAFEWQTEEQQIIELEDTTQVIEVEEVIATQTETPPPPPSAPKMPVLSDQIEIVEDAFCHLDARQDAVFLNDQLAFAHRCLGNAAQGGMIAIADVLSESEFDKIVNKFIHVILF